MVSLSFSLIFQSPKSTLSRYNEAVGFASFLLWRFMFGIPNTFLGFSDGFLALFIASNVALSYW
ncbi:hypothetical protein ES332_A06G216000v1 [Gossypium tomentosum]|uniref:Uncharacterized protein n=1 Tax=Gossypium tomentosum TaxID=34277 RepID=A0A5D2QAB6_GOSTO|nr:hypothetical protein ES332_A06G216000v1 [Gossypium tomentosum]